MPAPGRGVWGETTTNQPLGVVKGWLVVGMASNPVGMWLVGVYAPLPTNQSPTIGWIWLEWLEWDIIYVISCCIDDTHCRLTQARNQVNDTPGQRAERLPAILLDVVPDLLLFARFVATEQHF